MSKPSAVTQYMNEVIVLVDYVLPQKIAYW